MPEQRTFGPAIEHRIRVRYSETDQMGVVYYANYLVWFEVARTELCKRRGFSYADMERDTDSMLIVTEASCRYHAPARYDDEVCVLCSVSSLRSRSMTFSYEIYDATKTRLLADGETKHVVMDSSGKIKKFPPHHYRCLAGEPGEQPS